MDSIDTLESSLSSIETLVAFAIAAVVVGLVLEYGPEFFQHARERKVGITTVGAILVILGVAGELALHVRSSQIVSKIRVLQHDIDTAQRRTIAEITKQATELREKAASAEKSAADAQLALAKFKEHRSVKNAAAMIQKLRSFSGTPFDVGVQTDGEPVDLMAQITSVLVEAGWDWKPSSGSLSFNIPGRPNIQPIVLSGGIQIKFAKKRFDEWSTAVAALSEALKDENLVFLAVATDEVPDSAVHINFGTKP